MSPENAGNVLCAAVARVIYNYYRKPVQPTLAGTGGTPASPRLRLGAGRFGNTIRNDITETTDLGVNPMGFFDALRRVLTHETHAHVTDERKKRIRNAWGLDDDEPASDEEERAASEIESSGMASAYDRTQWDKKLRKILENLPASQQNWHDLMTEAQYLELDPAWIAERESEGFALMIRKAVSDRVISEDEHRKLDLARKLIGFSDAEAERTLHKIMAEAEAFFGSPVKDEA